jgi:hypothetical protein
MKMNFKIKTGNSELNINIMITFGKWGYSGVSQNYIEHCLLNAQSAIDSGDELIKDFAQKCLANGGNIILSPKDLFLNFKNLSLRSGYSEWQINNNCASNELSVYVVGVCKDGSYGVQIPTLDRFNLCSEGGTMSYDLTSQQIVSYLTDKNRRTLLNWTGIENKYLFDENGKVKKGRIKNVCIFEKGLFRPDEIKALTKAIHEIQFNVEYRLV